MPLKSLGDAGLGGSPFPWASKDEIVNVPVAVLQAYGMLNQQNQFQVVFVCQLLADAFYQNGEPVPNQFLVSIDAKGTENPRRRFLDYFADPNAEPLGPMSLQKIDANNQAGWAWSFRDCPLPVEMVGLTDQIERSLYRQDWKRMERAALNARQAVNAGGNGHQQANVPARQQTSASGDLEDLPF